MKKRRPDAKWLVPPWKIFGLRQDDKTKNDKRQTRKGTRKQYERDMTKTTPRKAHKTKSKTHIYKYTYKDTDIDHTNDKD